MSLRLPLRLIERRLLAPGVLHLGFEHADGKALPFKPGQFIQVFFADPQSQEVRRSYSLANPAPFDGEPMRWELAVSLLPGGVASDFLQRLPLGSTLGGAGPFGRFHLLSSDAPRRFLLVATGTGVAPFHAMLPELRRRALAGTPVEVVCGARTRDELLYRDAFLAVADEVPTFRYHGCLTRDMPAPDTPELIAGRVQPVLMALNPGRGDLALLCGNPGMVDDCAALLAGAGLSVRAVRRERYVASG